MLQLFRVAVLIAVIAWAVEVGDLSQRAQGFVEAALTNISQSVER